VREWRLPRWWQIHTRGYRVFAFGSSYERPPVSLYQLSIMSMFQKHIAVMTGHSNRRTINLSYDDDDVVAVSSDVNSVFVLTGFRSDGPPKWDFLDKLTFVDVWREVGVSSGVFCHVWVAYRQCGMVTTRPWWCLLVFAVRVRLNAGGWTTRLPWTCCSTHQRQISQHRRHIVINYVITTWQICHLPLKNMTDAVGGIV